MQYAVVLPAYLAVLMVIVQMALYFHAEHIATAAAAEAVATAGVDGGTDHDGQDEAEHILRATAGGFLLDPGVSVTRSAAVATVRISGRVVSLVPFVHMTVSSTAHGPIEQFTEATR